MIKYVKADRRLSIISDIVIFILLSFAAFLVLSIFKEVIISSSLSKENVSQALALKSENDNPIELENAQYIEKIKNEYKFDIKHSLATEELASRVNATVQKDTNIINNNLKKIYNALSKYSPSMFENLNKEGYKFTIVILDKFNNENIALASRNKLNQFTIYISNAEKLERAFHHEMCHILEYYLSDKGIKFSDWNNFNPENYKYLNSTENISSSNVYYSNMYSSDISDNIYFVTKYSKVNEKEDRAEIFAEILCNDNNDLVYIKDKTPIYYKANYLFSTFNLNIPYVNLNIH